MQPPTLQEVRLLSTQHLQLATPPDYECLFRKETGHDQIEARTALHNDSSLSL